MALVVAVARRAAPAKAGGWRAPAKGGYARAVVGRRLKERVAVERTAADVG